MANWYSESSPLERRTFWASFGGWALDALDVQMFSLAIPALIAAFHITKAEAACSGRLRCSSARSAAGSAARSATALAA